MSFSRQGLVEQLEYEGFTSPRPRTASGRRTARHTLGLSAGTLRPQKPDRIPLRGGAPAARGVGVSRVASQAAAGTATVRRVATLAMCLYVRDEGRGLRCTESRRARRSDRSSSPGARRRAQADRERERAIGKHPHFSGSDRCRYRHRNRRRWRTSPGEPWKPGPFLGVRRPRGLPVNRCRVHCDVVRAPTPRTALGEVRASRTFRLPSHPPMSRGEEKQPGV